MVKNGRWEKRWETLQRQIKSLKEQIEAANLSEANPPKINRHKSFIAILDCLEKFGKKQFRYFFKGFGKEANGYYYLETSQNLPSEHTLYRTLQQLSLDFSVLKYAWSQRLDSENLPIIDEYTKEYVKNKRNIQSTLNIADKLAYKALEPAIKAKAISPCTVITYLQKSPFIRLIPYAKVAIIGIPFTAVTNYEGDSIDEDAAFDLLAIPHEIGHFIYRHGQFKRDKDSGWNDPPYEKRLVVEIADRLHGQPEYLQNWAEEIFADIYGVLIAGPIAAVGIQELLQGKNKQEFTKDDNEHPKPAVRPYVHIEILQKVILNELLEKAEKVVETTIAEISTAAKNAAKTAVATDPATIAAVIATATAPAVAKEKMAKDIVRELRDKDENNNFDQELLDSDKLKFIRQYNSKEFTKQLELLKELNKDWGRIVRRRGEPDIKKEREAIKFFVKGFVEKIDSPLKGNEINTLWTSLDTPLNQLAGKFIDYVKKINNDGVTRVPEIVAKSFKSSTGVDCSGYAIGKDDKEPWCPGDPAYRSLEWVKGIRSQILKENDPRVPEALWKNVLEMAGWSDAGPDQQVNPVGTQG